MNKLRFLILLLWWLSLVNLYSDKKRFFKESSDLHENTLDLDAIKIKTVVYSFKYRIKPNIDASNEVLIVFNAID